MESIKIEITLQKDEHPGCWGKDCEGEHFQNNIHIRLDDNVVIFTEGTKEARVIESILHRLTNLPMGMDMQQLYAKAECEVCEETYHVQKMLSDLQHAKSLCKHGKK